MQHLSSSSPSLELKAPPGEWRGEGRFETVRRTFKTASGASYQLSWQLDPEHHRIAEFSLTPQSAPGLGDTGALPQFSATNIRGPLAEQIMLKLRRASESGTLESAPLEAIVREVLEVAPLKFLTPDEQLLERRFKGKSLLEIGMAVNDLISAEKVEASAITAWGQFLATMPGSRTKEEIIYDLIECAPRIPESQRAVTLEKLVQGISDMEWLYDHFFHFSQEKPAPYRSVNGLPACFAQALAMPVALAEVPKETTNNFGTQHGQLMSSPAALLAHVVRFADPKAYLKELAHLFVRSGKINIALSGRMPPLKKFFDGVTARYTEEDMITAVKAVSNVEEVQALFKNLKIFEGVTREKLVVQLLRSEKFRLIEPGNLQGFTIEGPHLCAAISDLGMKRNSGSEDEQREELINIIRHRRIFPGVTMSALLSSIAASPNGQRIFDKFTVDIDMFQELLAGVHEVDGEIQTRHIFFSPTARAFEYGLTHLPLFSPSRQEFLSFVRDFNRIAEKSGDRSYVIKCLIENAEVIPDRYFGYLEERLFLKTYITECGLPSAAVYATFFSHMKRGDRAASLAFLRGVEATRRKVISSEPQSESDFSSEMAREILSTVFRSGEASNRNRQQLFGGCKDRSSDLARFKVRPVYRMNLAEGVDMIRKSDTIRNSKGITRIESCIEKAFARAVWSGQDPKKAFDVIRTELNAKENVRSVEEVLLDHIISCNNVNSSEREKIKELLVLYQIGSHPQIVQYANETTERAKQAKNVEYAHLLELHEYLSDRLLDGVKELLDKGLRKQKPEKLLEIFAARQKQELDERRHKVVAKHQAHRLGDRAKLAKRIDEAKAAALKKGDQLDAKMCEDRITLDERQRIASFLSELNGSTIKPDAVNLETFSVESALEAQRGMAPPVTLERAQNYFSEELRSFFAPEVQIVADEIKSFAPAENRERKARVLEGFITKNLASSLARQCAGVCVANDNPAIRSDYAAHHVAHSPMSQWELPNYLQLVLRCPESLNCVGLCLMHFYEEQGKKLLSVSFNPSSTYVFKVDEAGLFRGLLNAVVEFARDNQIDMVLCSKEPTIRTNRTAGQFEIALDARVREVKKTFSLQRPQPFSFHPKYYQQHFDVLWEKR